MDDLNRVFIEGIVFDQPRSLGPGLVTFTLISQKGMHNVTTPIKCTGKTADLALSLKINTFIRVEGKLSNHNIKTGDSSLMILAVFATFIEPDSVFQSVPTNTEDNFYRVALAEELELS